MGELEEFIEILRLLRKRSTISKIEIIINELPEGIFRRRFARLNDGIKRRKYAIGKITMTDGKKCSLIEIEREDKALSMLILKTNEKVKWDWVYSRLLLQLVEESGKWGNEVIKKIEEHGLVVYRSKHIKKSTYEKVTHIYEKTKF